MARSSRRRRPVCRCKGLLSSPRASCETSGLVLRRLGRTAPSPSALRHRGMLPPMRPSWERVAARRAPARRRRSRRRGRARCVRRAVAKTRSHRHDPLGQHADSRLRVAMGHSVMSSSSKGARRGPSPTARPAWRQRGAALCSAGCRAATQYVRRSSKGTSPPDAGAAPGLAPSLPRRCSRPSRGALRRHPEASCARSPAPATRCPPWASSRRWGGAWSTHQRR